MVCLRSENRVSIYIGYVQNLEKIGKACIDPYLKLFGKEDAAPYIIFYTHVHACSLGYTDEE